jgi:hypothetical protein
MESINSYKNSPNSNSKHNKNSNSNHSRNSSYGSYEIVATNVNSNNNPNLLNSSKYSSNTNLSGHIKNSNGNASITNVNNHFTNQISKYSDDFSTISDSYAATSNQESPQNMKQTTIYPYMSSKSVTPSISTTSSAGSPIVAKVNIEISNDLNNNSLNKNDDQQLISSTVVYKRIYIRDCDRTKDIKRTILEKFLYDPDLCDKYMLVQILNATGNGMGALGNLTNHSGSSDSLGGQQAKELIISDNCNVYYAAKSVPEMQFVLRRRPAIYSASNGYLNGMGSSNLGSNNSNSSNNSPISVKQQKQTNGVNSSFTSATSTATTISPVLFRSNQNSSSNVSNMGFDLLPPQSPSSSSVGANLNSTNNSSSRQRRNSNFLKKIIS